MRIHNISDLEDFVKVINSCEGNVWLESTEGDKINLKSQLSQYIALGALLSERGDCLELFCSDRNDEAKMVGFFRDHPGVE